MRSDILKLTAVGAFAVFMIVVLGVTLGNVSFFGNTSYGAVFEDSSGLRDRDDVRVNGVLVGSVSAVKAVDGIAEVTFKIDSERRITTQTLATVKYKNVIGQRYLDLSTPIRSGERLAEGDVIPLDQTAGALDLTVLFNGFRPLFDALEPDQINTLAQTLVQTLQGETGNIASLVGQLSSLTGTLADRDAVIGSVIDNLDLIVATVADRDDSLRRLLDDLRSLSATAAADRSALTDAFTGIDKLAATTGNLLEQARPPLQGNIAGLNQLLGTVVDNQDQISAAVQGLPSTLAALNRAFDSGSWLAVYGCNLRFTITSGTFDDPGEPITSGTTEDCR